MERNATACIIGAGRIGFKGLGTKFCYDHYSAYQRLKIFDVIGISDPNVDPPKGCKIDWFRDYKNMLRTLKPDIVSICTPEGTHARILQTCERHGVKGVWCEKPVEVKKIPDIPVQVNYIRRFEDRHNKNMPIAPPNYMVFHCRKDMNTVCHFTNYAQYLNCRKMYFIWNDNPYVMTDYEAYWDDEAIRWTHGGSRVHYFEPQPMPAMPDNIGLNLIGMHKWQPVFMENALANLFTCVKTNGSVGLDSPAKDAVESEKLAMKILRGENRNADGSYSARWA